MGPLSKFQKVILAAFFGPRAIKVHLISLKSYAIDQVFGLVGVQVNSVQAILST